MKTFEITIFFDDLTHRVYYRNCEDYSDARCKAEEIIETLYYQRIGHKVTGYEVKELTD